MKKTTYKYIDINIYVHLSYTFLSVGGRSPVESIGANVFFYFPSR